MKLLRVEGDEERAQTVLSVASGHEVPHAVIGALRRVAKHWHGGDKSPAAIVLIYYESAQIRNTPVLRWNDDKNLSVDLGQVTWLTPQISQLGRVTISYTYSGAEPSLE
jgi:hypothetical protein